MEQNKDHTFLMLFESKYGNFDYSNVLLEEIQDITKKYYIVKKIGHGLEHVKRNLRFFGLSLSFYSSF